MAMKKKFLFKKDSSKINYKQLIDYQIKKKYLYLLVGLTVIIAGYFLLKTVFVKKPRTASYPTTKKEISIKPKTSEKKKKEQTYIVKSGDYLWKIAEETYGSGFNAYDIARVNKINNPDLIYSGNKLILPSLTPKAPTKGEIVTAKTEKVTITQSTYKVQEGDCLWQIALGAYGDGYAWVKIARANNLTNPDLIYPGTVLNLPR